MDQSTQTDLFSEQQIPLSVATSAPKQVPLSKIDKLVFSGGSLKGCAHIGVIKYLEEHHVINQIRSLAGCSIGSLVALLLNLSYTSAEMEDCLDDFDYIKYQSIDICHLVTHFGLDTFEKIHQYIAHLMTRKNVSPEITFEQLYQQTHIHLIMNAVCLNTHTNTFFDYQSSPQMPVIVAVRASMTLPFVFGSMTYQHLTYVDGGVLDNFPIDFPLFNEAPDTVLGVNLHNLANFSIREISTIDQYCTHLFSCLYDTYLDLATQTHQHPSTHVINISTAAYGALDLSLSTQDKLALIKLGYQKTQDYFQPFALITGSIPSTELYSEETPQYSVHCGKSEQ
uniref:PNPLA domain-containing protein n=1 Tax=viral metagenome TaxID=1070528 RepID=A0A6C0BK43_9ZZZZ